MGLKKINIVLIVGTAMIVSHCSSNFYIPTSLQISYAKEIWPEADSAYLLRGYNLYVNKCGGCHYLYKPDSYKPERWNKVLPIMRDKAKLNEEEYNCINRYIQALSNTDIKTKYE